MNRVDLLNIEEFTNVAIGQMEMCNDILTGRDSHPFLEVLPSGERMALATHISMADAMLKGLAVLVSSILEHTPEEEGVTGLEVRFMQPNGFTLRSDGKVYNGNDGHSYWLDDGEWVGAGTLMDGTLDSDEGTSVDDFEMEGEDKARLKDLLSSFWRSKHPDKGARECVHSCANSFWVWTHKGAFEGNQNDGHYRCTDPLHWIENQDDEIPH